MSILVYLCLVQVVNLCYYLFSLSSEPTSEVCPLRRPSLSSYLYLTSSTCPSSVSDVRSKITTLTCTQLSSKYYKIVVPSPYPRFAPCVPVLGDSQSFVVFCTIMVVELSMQNKINKCQGLTADFTAIHTLDILCVLLVKGLSQCAYHWKIEKKTISISDHFQGEECRHHLSMCYIGMVGLLSHINPSRCPQAHNN